MVVSSAVLIRVVHFGITTTILSFFSRMKIENCTTELWVHTEDGPTPAPAPPPPSCKSHAKLEESFKKKFAFAADASLFSFVVTAVFVDSGFACFCFTSDTSIRWNSSETTHHMDCTGIFVCAAVGGSSNNVPRLDRCE
jgi:hypothetical protein